MENPRNSSDISSVFCAFPTLLQFLTKYAVWFRNRLSRLLLVRLGFVKINLLGPNKAHISRPTLHEHDQMHDMEMKTGSKGDKIKAI